MKAPVFTSALLAAALTLAPMNADARKWLRLPKPSKPTPTLGQSVKRISAGAAVWGILGYTVANNLSQEYLIAASLKQHENMLNEYRARRTLLASEHPTTVRVAEISRRVLLGAGENPSEWQVSVVDEPTVNAFCLPGNKIVIFTGIIDQLNLSNQQIAAIIWHEVVHVKKNHALERIRHAAAIHTAIVGGGMAIGVDTTWAHLAAQIPKLEFSRSHETQADLLGIQYARRAGYRVCPDTAELWEKVSARSTARVPEILSSHPDPASRSSRIQKEVCSE